MRFFYFYLIILFAKHSFSQTWELKQITCSDDATPCMAVFECQAKINTTKAEFTLPTTEASWYYVDLKHNLSADPTISYPLLQVKETKSHKNMAELLQAHVGDLVDIELGFGENGSFSGIILPFQPNDEVLLLQTGKQIEALAVNRIQSISLGKSTLDKSKKTVLKEGIRLTFPEVPGIVTLVFTAQVPNLVCKPRYSIDYDPNTAEAHVKLLADINLPFIANEKTNFAYHFLDYNGHKSTLQLPAFKQSFNGKFTFTIDEFHCNTTLRASTIDTIALNQKWDKPYTLIYQLAIALPANKRIYPFNTLCYTPYALFNTNKLNKTSNKEVSITLGMEPNALELKSGKMQNIATLKASRKRHEIVNITYEALISHPRKPQEVLLLFKSEPENKLFNQVQDWNNALNMANNFVTQLLFFPLGSQEVSATLYLIK